MSSMHNGSKEQQYQVKLIAIGTEQHRALKTWSAQYELSMLKIVNAIVDYFRKNPEKLSEVLKGSGEAEE